MMRRFISGIWKRVLSLLIAGCVCFVFWGCEQQPSHIGPFVNYSYNYFPDTGRWYCSSLGALMSYDSHLESFFVYDSVKEPSTWGVNKGAKRISFCWRSPEGVGFSGKNVFRGIWRQREEDFFVIRDDDGDDHTFVRITIPEGIDRGLSMPEQPLESLISGTYSATELEEIATFSGDMARLHEKYPIECLRLTKGFYRAVYLGQQQVAVVWFDLSGQRVAGMVQNLQIAESTMESLRYMQSVDDVKEMDAQGMFLYPSTEKYYFSAHCTVEGKLFVFLYNKQDRITTKWEEWI